MKIAVKSYPSEYIAVWLFPEKRGALDYGISVWDWITHNYNEDDYLHLANEVETV